MNQSLTAGPNGSVAATDETAATEKETREYLLKRSKREAAPILKAFVQDPDKKPHRAGPLSTFVRHGDLRALRAFLLLHAIISSGKGDNGWSTTLALKVWARAFDTTTSADARSASTAATKLLTRLTDRKLISRQRTGRERKITVTLLRPDGTGAPYTRPGQGNSDRFLNLSNAYWTDDWYDKLDLPATAMLLVALHEKPAFELATEKVPDWYGWSADTAERGLKTLESLGLITVTKRTKKAPLAPTGLTIVNSYTLIGPFAHPAPATATATPANTARKKLKRLKRTPAASASRQGRSKVPPTKANPGA